MDRNSLPKYRRLRAAAVGLGGLALLGSTWHIYARAEETRPRATESDSNPYIELYTLRVAQSEANVERQAAIVELAKSKLERGRRLYAQNAMSLEEYETLKSEAAVANSDLALANQRVQESKAYFKIISALVARGESIPLCTYEME